MSNLKDNVCLVQFTKEELIRKCKQDDYEMWGAPQLTLDQYQEKEALQRSTRFSKRGSCFWGLVTYPHKDISNSIEELYSDAHIHVNEVEIICHCETHMFDCVYFNATNKILTQGVSHHIASVFTLPSYRKQGYATYFLQNLAQALANKPNALASVLYSDIGPTFYDNLGWSCYPSTVGILHVSQVDNMIPFTKRLDMESLYLNDQLETLLQYENNRLMQEIVSKESNQSCFAVLPSRDSMEWQFCIGQYYSKAVYHYNEQVQKCGLKCLTNDSYITWCYNFKESTLYILTVRFIESETCISLFQAALKEAKQHHLQYVKIWDPPSSLFTNDVQKFLTMQLEERDDSLSSLMIFNNQKNETRVQWLKNEKFAWV